MSASVETRGEAVYESLKRGIVSLEVEPGTPLHEAEITKLYGASRTPVREALARLGHEGFVVRWGRAYRVRSFSPDEVKELYEIREALEKMAVRLTIEKSDSRKLAVIERQLADYEIYKSSGDVKAFNLHANRFHTTIAEMSQNAALYDQLAIIHEKVRIISAKYLIRKDSISHAHDDHQRIYQAIIRKDITVAESLMRDHIQGVIIYFKSHSIDI